MRSHLSVLAVTTTLVSMLCLPTLAKQNVQSYENNFYVIMSTSSFNFNYRHSLNALLFYQYLKHKGIRDDHILLMLPTDHACNARNYFPGTLYGLKDHTKNWICEDVEVDYKSSDMDSDAILNMMRGRYAENYPQSKKLQTNSDSRIFMFWNGHGGENFFKIQDTELVHSEDLAKVIDEMHLKGMYKEMVLLFDTCEGLSMFDQITTPDVYMISSSRHDESALASDVDFMLNQFLSDNFSREFFDFLWRPNGYAYKQDSFSLQDFETEFDFQAIKSHVSFVNTAKRPLKEVLLKEWIPTGDITLGEGIDSKQEGTKFFNWEDLLQ